MDKIQLQLPDGRTSQILIGEQLKHLVQYTQNRKTVIITDPTVQGLYQDHFPEGVPVITIPPGETHKTLETVQQVITQLIENDVDRNCFLVGIGGGIICDLTGFIASIYMRGLRFGFVSSTLLAQVDASVGGKNGANSGGYKNMIGVFNQPDFVICDTQLLHTLPEREFRSGLAEVIKAALLTDATLFDYLENNQTAVKTLQAPAINYLVKRSVEIKAEIVAADEREAGERRKLNLGHTFGHAVEKHAKILHGEAVSIGICMAAHISHQLGMLTTAEVDRIKRILTAYDLPTHTDLEPQLLLNAITKDKKREGGSVHFVLLAGIGKAVVKQLQYTELEKLIGN